MTDDTEAAGGGTAPDPYMQEIAGLTGLVAEARKLVQGGNVIDMGNFQDRVGELCKAIVEDPPENAEAVMGAIQRLVADLNDLAEDLKALHADGAGG